MTTRTASQHTILHVDMDAFFASIEQRDNPELKGKPIVVGGRSDQRGVVAAASYEARVYGIHSAMPSARAEKLCPGIIFVPGRMEVYSRVSRQLMDILERFTPIIEKLSIDEAFLDVTGSLHLWGDASTLALQLKSSIREALHLTASVGLAPNKFLAKLASDMDKPDGFTRVPFDPEAIAAFLRPLPVTRIWGIGKASASKLHQQHLYTIGDVQAAEASRLVDVLGPAAAERLATLARGEDHRAVETVREEKSISNEKTYAQDLTALEDMRRELIRLSEKVGRRLRAHNKYAGTVIIKIRYADFTTFTRQEPLRPASHKDRDLITHVLSLFENTDVRRGVRLLGVGTTQLVEHPEDVAPPQLDLFSTPETPVDDELDEALDRVREKYGPASIRRGIPPPE